MIFALVGNQNSGKTTLFNALTGANQHVGNFPGVTVDQKIGKIRQAKDCSVVDLPGIYSIRPYSTEEIVTRDFVLNEKPDGIINIVDATNIERNLYLTLQLLELRIPMVLALNMMDEVHGNGGTINIDAMSKSLGIPVVPISAVKSEGIAELVHSIINVSTKKILPSVLDFCPPGPVHRCIHSVSHLIEDHAESCGISSRFSATKLIEGDTSFSKKLQLDQNEIDTIAHSVIEMENECEMDANAALADMRYSFIEKVCEDSVVKAKESKEHRRSVKIDKVLTNKHLALPLFFIIMIVIFWLTFSVIGSSLADFLSHSINKLTEFISISLSNYQINQVVRSLIIDGIFAGVGSVLSFLPIIVVLFFFLSILEDTGYMARVAFVMDKLLRKIGLSGRSFVPMIIGFGCTVPAIMATRTLSSERDRKLTILLTPFMSCSAKIPIYAVFCAAFFPNNTALVMSLLYISGMVVGIIVALIMNKTTFKGNPVPFVMELPNYRLPSMRSVLLLMWDKAKDFLQKAFTVILISTVIIWFLGSFNSKFNFVTDSSTSLLASLGRFISPIFAPLGLQDWRISTSLLAGLSAKEAVVSTMSVLTSTSLENLSSSLSSLFTTASAASFLVFTLLYTPCIAAIATLSRELNSKFKTFLIVVGQCTIAWVCAFIVYQVGNFFMLTNNMNIFDYILISIIILCLISALTFVIKQRKKGNHVGCGNCNTCYKNCTKYKNNKDLLK